MPLHVDFGHTTPMISIKVVQENSYNYPDGSTDNSAILSLTSSSVLNEGCPFDQRLTVNIPGRYNTYKPGILLGEPGEGKVKVATTGRLKVKVDATKVPVQVGDLLVTSDQEGYAMKSKPMEVGGILIHRPGTLIGKALEPLQEGQGEILVLLSLQ